MTSKPRSRIVDYVVYLAVRTCIWLLQMMPAHCAVLIARLLGRLAHLVDKRHREVAAENLRHAFPDFPAAEIDRLVRASYVHVCTMAVETAVLIRRMKPDNVKRLVYDVNPDDSRFAWEIVFSGKPVIVMTGHIGNWEVLSLAMAMQGGTASVVARPLDNPYLDRYVNEVRTSTGISIVAKRGAVEEAEQVLAAGGRLGLVGDQDAGPKGLFVDFMGRPASTFKSIALLALQYQAPILVLGCVRAGEPLRHLLTLEDAIMPAEYMSDPGAVRKITERYSAALERIVRRHPEQYFWLHRRWKHQPPVRKPKMAA